MLTKKQNELLRFIHERIKEAGTPPSFEEMKIALNLCSKSGIHRLIMALEERGFIRRLPNRARALEVLKMPYASIPAGRSAAVAFIPNIVDGALDYARAHHLELGEDFSSSTATIPIMGRIAAGTPIAAIQNHSRNLQLPIELLSKGEHFALEVKGDSMIEAGIFEDDTVIVRRQEVADTGDLIIALIDDNEATLKRLRRRGASVALEAANPAYETRIFPPSRVKIQGKVVSLIRRY